MSWFLHEHFFIESPTPKTYKDMKLNPEVYSKNVYITKEHSLFDERFHSCEHEDDFPGFKNSMQSANGVFIPSIEML